jgi:hypothetical protein
VDDFSTILCNASRGARMLWDKQLKVARDRYTNLTYIWFSSKPNPSIIRVTQRNVKELISSSLIKRVDLRSQYFTLLGGDKVDTYPVQQFFMINPDIIVPSQKAKYYQRIWEVL